MLLSDPLLLITWAMLLETNIIRYGQSAYVEALHRLQKSLKNSTECVSSDVFCAVMLSCLYEVRNSQPFG